MDRISRSLEGRTLSHSHCRYCDQENVELSDIGWLDPTPGDTYDLCPGSPYGGHEPVRARGETSRRCGPREPRRWGTAEQEFLANLDARSAEQFRDLFRQILDTRAHVRS